MFFYKAFHRLSLIDRTSEYKFERIDENTVNKFLMIDLSNKSSCGHDNLSLSLKLNEYIKDVIKAPVTII